MAPYLETMFGPVVEVYAAASLKEAVTNLAKTFEASHPGVTVRLTFAGSQTLAAQIAHGAPADVFASASAKNLQGFAYDPKTRKVFATNRLVIISYGKKVDLKGLSDVERLVLAAPAVPAGGYARKAFDTAATKYGKPWLAKVNAHVVSEENDVRAVLAKVKLGEADAGVVYASDAISAGKGLFATPLPTAFQPRIEYPAVVLKDAPSPRLAREFMTLLLSARGRQALLKQGFGAP